MIILNSPKPKRFGRYIFLGLLMICALGILFSGAVDFGKLRSAWDDPERIALFNAGMQIVAGMIGMIGMAWKLTEQLTVGDPLQRLVATEETLAIKTIGKRIIFLKRRDCIALSHDGYGLVMADGKRHKVHAYGARRETVDAFLASLYELWWPRLTHKEVRDYLKPGNPRRSPMRFLPIYLLMLAPILILRLRLEHAFRDSMAIMLGTIIVTCILGIRENRRVREAILKNQFPLRDHPEDSPETDCAVEVYEHADK